MKLGLIGLPGSGKQTIFEALTGLAVDPGLRREDQLGTITVPDERVDRLSELYVPQKTIYAQVEYLLPGRVDGGDQDSTKAAANWLRAKECDALIQVVRNFTQYGLAEPDPQKDIRQLEEELILADLMVAEKRAERLAKDQKRGKKANPEEWTLIQRCLEHLNNGTALREDVAVANAPLLRGFALLSAKPILYLYNQPDEVAANTEQPDNSLTIQGKLEQELAQMSAEEALELQSLYDIEQSAADRVIQRSYELLGQISFFTVGQDEVRAWTIKKGDDALTAAGAIHSDIQKGFIRAEVLAYDDLMTAGTYANARKQGTVRLEGKTYQVQDGDIAHFRFNV
jgi:GTP-binding protein YchF